METARRLVSRSRASAQSRGMDFNVTPESIYDLMEASKFHCCLSGIAFSTADRLPGDTRNPWAPSIDRIDSRGGYTRDNVRVVSVAANLALADWGYDVLLRLAEGMVNNSRPHVLSSSPDFPSTCLEIANDETKNGAAGGI